jgi:hypothetical protein
MALLASVCVLGELILALGRSRGQRLAAALSASAPRFVMGALFGASIGYVLHVFGIKVTP